MWEMRPVGYFENPNSPRLRSASRVRGGSQTPIRPHADTASLRRSIFTRNCQMPTDILTARPACNSPPTRKHTRVWDSLDRRDAYPLRTLLPHTRNPRSGLNEVRIHDSCASYALSLLQLTQSPAIGATVVCDQLNIRRTLAVPTTAAPDRLHETVSAHRRRQNDRDLRRRRKTLIQLGPTRRLGIRNEDDFGQTRRIDRPVVRSSKFDSLTGLVCFVGAIDKPSHLFRILFSDPSPFARKSRHRFAAFGKCPEKRALNPVSRHRGSHRRKKTRGLLRQSIGIFQNPRSHRNIVPEQDYLFILRKRFQRSLQDRFDLRAFGGCISFVVEIFRQPALPS